MAVTSRTSANVMIKVWIKRDQSDSEKIPVAPGSDIDDLKTEVFGRAEKGQYRATYKDQSCAPSMKVPQDTTDVTPVLFVKISQQVVAVNTIPIRITTNDGKRITVDVDPGDTIMNIKTVYLKPAMASQKIKIDALDQQHLTYLGQQLRDDRTCADYKIKANAELKLVHKDQTPPVYPPGAVIDNQPNPNNNPGAPQRPLVPQPGTAFAYQQNLNNNLGAPQWRHASGGLCFEGICKNEACVAHLQKVLIKMGYRKFDMVKNLNDCKCPMCQKAVEPQTCGFSNCWWRWYGTQQESESAPLKKCAGEWEYADNAYHYYDEQTSGTATWRDLVLEVSENRP